MSTISSGTTTVAGVGIRGEQLGGEADMGLPVERGGGRTDDALMPCCAASARGRTAQRP